MFTSRAEHRLLLREDNADWRLTPVGRSLGVVDDARIAAFERKYELIEQEQARLAGIVLRPGDAPAGSPFAPLAKETRAAQLLARPEGGYADVVALPAVGRNAALEMEDAELAEQVRGCLETNARYAGYIERQRREIDRTRRQSELRLPADLDYDAVAGLSNEVREKLIRIRPDSLGQAARIPGITPAAVSLLLVHLKKRGAPTALASSQ